MQRRVADTVKAVNATGQPRFTGFYNDREITLATAQLNSLGWQGYTFYGGREGAERKMLCVFEDTGGYTPFFPIKAVQVDVPEGGSLTHRDYLGALLGTGLERSCFGDIVVGNTGALVYMQDKVCEYVLQQLDSIGRYAASTTEANQQPEQEIEARQASGETIGASVSSLRLDAVLAAMLHLSRNDAATYITRGFVMVNHLEVDSLHYRVEEGDIFSIRGEGKYRLHQIGGASRKKRIRIEYVKY